MQQESAVEVRQMSKILDCDARQCIYNEEGKCITFAITVGSEKPCCDTFMTAHGGVSKGGIHGIVGGVGACHMADCKFNAMLECSAPGIHVTVPRSGCPDCGTYQKR